MKILNTWIMWSMVSMLGVPYSGSVQVEQIEPATYTMELETEIEPLKAEPITEPIKAEVIVDEPETTVEVSDVEVSEVYEIDNEVLETCDHEYTRTHGTGGEEGDVWEYVCDKCGDTYFEPYDGKDEDPTDYDYSEGG